MTKALIRRIDKIDNYRIFQNWKWDMSIPDFPRVNLIYGQNGSGKSTLANLFHDCTTSQLAALQSGIQLQVDFNNNTRSITAADTTFWSRVRVFNKQFIDQNLAFNEASGPQPESLLTIGKRSIEIEAELEELRGRLSETEQAFTSAQALSKQAFDHLGYRFADVARLIVSDLVKSGIKRYQGSNRYNRRQVRELLQRDRSIFDEASTDRAADVRTATELPMDVPMVPARPPMADYNDVQTAIHLIKTDISNLAIEELRNHADRAKWVQDGLRIHKDLNNCLFCGQPFTASRRQALASHFNSQLIELQRQIDLLTQKVNDAITASADYLNALPNANSLYPDLRSNFQIACQQYAQEHDRYSTNAKQLVDTLTAKRDNPFSPNYLNPNIQLVVPNTDTIDAILNKQQDRTTRHQQEVKAAARRVELAHVRDFLKEYDSLQSDLNSRQGEELDLKNQCISLRNKIDELESIDTDPAPSARQLTAYVSHLLGREELEFKLTPDQKHYAITRLGSPASHLSEGEQTAIALLYFLVSVRKENIAGDAPTVVIDDPVSSLDSNIMFGASAHLWSELVSTQFANQVFIMTHNFELFRQWLYQMQPIARDRNTKEVVCAAFEIRTAWKECEDGDMQRIPRLHAWNFRDDATKKLRSHYHFLFSHVANTLIQAHPDLSLAKQMEIAALLPNAARRLLEAFLGFRCPDKMGSFHGSMRAALERNPGLDDSIRIHVERYLHAYSHLEDGDILHPLAPGESTVVLRSLFQFMDHVDHGHVSSMCTALGLDYDRLMKAPTLPASRSVSS